MFTEILHPTKKAMAVFDIAAPAQVLVKTTSGYKILDLYVRDSNNQVYAANGSYLIALMREGLTTNAKITWKELDGIEELYDNSYLTHEIIKTNEE